MFEDNTQTAFDAVPNAQSNDERLIELPLILMSDQVIMPYTIAPVALSSGESANLLAAQQATTQVQTVLHMYRRTDDHDLPLLEQFHKTATEISLIDITDDFDEGIRLYMAQGRRRVEVIEVIQEDPFVIVRGRVVSAELVDDDKLIHHRNEARDLFNDIADLTNMIPEDVMDYVYLVDSDIELGDVIAASLQLTTDERQALLDELHLEDRFEMLHGLAWREYQALEVRDDVNHQVHDEISRAQREMILREQMRVIQNELGEGDDFEEDIKELQERVFAARLPKEVHTEAIKELKRLAAMPPVTPEASIIRTYLEWLVDLPWHHESKDRLNLRYAEKVLNSEHYGLKKVKERILEHIAVRKLAKDKMKTPIICFVGPPGVGKTSMGRSIADALGREFVRVSLGGVRDEAEIRGHRRTYIGAMPGRIIQTIKRAGTLNPVFMLDEIDKMTEDYRGDPASALLEVLDPEQNNTFSDHYLEVPYDLSNVLFIATANELYPLPEALEDRMEIIEFNAYTEEEKLEIARRFLIPKQLEAHGLSRRGIQFQQGALETIIRYYTLEAGVRNLEREIANVCRKITHLAALRKKYPKRITAKLVEKYLGPPYFIDPRLSQESHIGLVTGLVWTSGGGDIQLIEAALLTGKGSLTLTGQLGEVLQESAQLALNYMRWCADDFDVPHDDFDNYDVHIHLPEGGVPKDGPSAGITLAVAIISVFTERPVRNNWAMTGEVTLRGHVLPVGGITEKVLAARRRGITNLILPADNEKDLVELPKKALRGLNIELVTHMQQVIDLILMEAPEQRERDADEDDDGEDDLSEDANLD